MHLLYLIVPLAPLAGAVVAGLFGWAIGRENAHRVTIAGMLVSLVAAALVFHDVLNGGGDNVSVYKWMESGNVRFEIGFLVERDWRRDRVPSASESSQRREGSVARRSARICRECCSARRHEALGLRGCRACSRWSRTSR